MNKEDVKKGYLAAMSTMNVDSQEAIEYWESYESAQYWGKYKLASDGDLASVSDRRELLINFVKYVVDFDSHINGSPESIVDEYINSR